MRASAPVACCAMLAAALAAAGEHAGSPLFRPGADRLQLQLATYLHYEDSDDYAGPPIYGGVEVRKRSGWLYGLGLFNNSYDQFSQYLYFGRQIDLRRFGDRTLHLKVSGGIAHGYHGEHEDALPVRVGDIGPVIIPALGMHSGRWSTDLVFLVDEAVMFNLGYDILD